MASPSLADNIFPFPDEKRVKQGGSGDGPEDRLIERVARLEADLSEIKVLLRDHGRDLTETRVSIGRIEGQLKSAPTIVQLLGIVLATWAAGAAIVATLLRVLR
jgi:hypothetical protein